MGFKAIINNQHWGLLHKNELFKFVRRGMREQAFIREIRPDGKISLTLQQPGRAGAESLQELADQNMYRMKNQRIQQTLK